MSTNKYLEIYMSGPLPEDIITTFEETEAALLVGKPIVRTTQPHFASFDWADKGYHIMVRLNNLTFVELKEGDCLSSGRQLRKAHNLEKLIIAGEFGGLQ